MLLITLLSFLSPPFPTVFEDGLFKIQVHYPAVIGSRCLSNILPVVYSTGGPGALDTALAGG